MKTYALIGGSSTIAQTLIKSLENQDVILLVYSRSEDLFHKQSNVTWKQFDILKDEFNSSEIPSSVDALLYFPGTINLKPFNSLKIDDFQSDYEINFLGAVKAINAFYRPLRKSGNGSIVMVSSVAAKVGMPYHASIASAKAAVEGLTRSLAAEFAPHIRVNCIAPSLTDTQMASKLLSTEDRKNSIVQRNPMKQIGKPEDLAAMAEFLISEKSAWITGQVIGVDGGMSTLNLV
ncbi:MAG: SDR family oxidoreductase [Bacteroidales bacterium]|nr:SDR family oxidoreductase [Bacteroidales bacterium]